MVLQHYWEMFTDCFPIPNTAMWLEHLGISISGAGFLAEWCTCVRSHDRKHIGLSSASCVSGWNIVCAGDKALFNTLLWEDLTHSTVAILVGHCIKDLLGGLW